MLCGFVFFFFKQKTAYEISVRDWSSDVCSSDLRDAPSGHDADIACSCRPVGALENLDRKSVVWGKSVNACVDLGGRRIIKKKKGRKRMKRMMWMRSSSGKCRIMTN